ncbi:nitrilase-related carbon-nitrogen hydrolase [Tianweitania populi]|uniref:Nitrilase n=1 Tax=Tianweitania populi TaxID=1607949 RepID=A0A8J3DXN9_9HYPH|nr:nitrilase-related carbon-nitrogen hydrolase [Tianweitania populi]GHD21099.1 nitrilase [Tianweitania populi]
MTINDSAEFRRIKVAAVQAEPAFLDLEGSTRIACDLIAEAGRNGADLIAFPENFVPSYPNWYETLSEGAKARDLDRRLFLNSVVLPGEHISTIADACRQAGVNAVVGINERRARTTGTTFNTQVHITRDGVIAGKHQKYVPTTGERQIQAPGTTGHHNSFETDFGIVSGLICGENSNPLGQYAAAVHYPVVHVASWPAYFGPGVTLQHAIQTASAGLAYSLKCFVLSAVLRLSDAYIEAVAATDADREYLEVQRAAKQGAMIFSPIGERIGDGTGSDERLVYADIDLGDVIIPKMVHDTAGHYNRPELFAPLFAPREG